MSQYGVPVEVVNFTGTKGYGEMLGTCILSLFRVEKVRLHWSHRLLSSVPITACMSVRVRLVIQVVRLSNAWGNSRSWLVVSVSPVKSSCIAVCSVITVGGSDTVDKCMSDNMSIPASDMLSQVVVSVSNNACISADTDPVSPAIEYLNSSYCLNHTLCVGLLLQYNTDN